MTTKDPFQTPGLSISMKGVNGVYLKVLYVGHRSSKTRAALKNSLIKSTDSFCEPTIGKPRTLIPFIKRWMMPQSRWLWCSKSLWRWVLFRTRLFQEYCSLSRPGQVLPNRLPETDLVDYNTRNYKMTGAFHYKFRQDLQLIYAANFGSGTTVYQGITGIHQEHFVFSEQNRVTTEG